MFCGATVALPPPPPPVLHMNAVALPHSRLSSFSSPDKDSHRSGRTVQKSASSSLLPPKGFANALTRTRQWRHQEGTITTHNYSDDGFEITATTTTHTLFCRPCQPPKPSSFLSSLDGARSAFFPNPLLLLMRLGGCWFARRSVRQENSGSNTIANSR